MMDKCLKDRLSTIMANYSEWVDGRFDGDEWSGRNKMFPLNVGRMRIRFGRDGSVANVVTSYGVSESAITGRWRVFLARELEG